MGVTTASAACTCRSFVLRIPFEDARSLRNASEYSAMGGSAEGYQRRQQSVSIIHDGRRLIWNYNRPLVRQPAKLVHSRSQTRACALARVGGSAIYVAETKAARAIRQTGRQECRLRYLFSIPQDIRREADAFTISANTIESQSESRVWRVSRSLRHVAINLDRSCDATWIFQEWRRLDVSLNVCVVDSA